MSVTIRRIPSTDAAERFYTRNTIPGPPRGEHSQHIRVATIQRIPATEAAERFYIDDNTFARPEAKADLPGTVPRAFWFNPAGLFKRPHDSPVRTDEFLVLFRRLSLADVSQPIPDVGRAPLSPGIDIAFFADKSISAVWAIADPDVRTAIAAAHDAAVRKSLERWLGRECAVALRRNAEGSVEVASADIIAAIMPRGKDRNAHPHLHTRCLCFNIVRTRSDAKWRPHYPVRAFHRIHDMGASYTASLAQTLQQGLGFRVERYGKDSRAIRIVGVPRTLIESWSSPDDPESPFAPAP